MKSGGEIKCSAGTVLVPKGTYEGQEVGPLCFDQSEFANDMKSQVQTNSTSGFQLVNVSREDGVGDVLLNGTNASDLLKRVSVGQAVLPVTSGQLPQSPKGFDRPRQPLVMVPGKQIRLPDGQALLGAKEICEARGMRLATPIEWAYAASGPNHFDYSTRNGKLERPGVNYCAVGDCPDSTRDVGAAKGHYVQWGADELYDMSGNAWEWTYDSAKNEFYISGGSWYLYYFGGLRAVSRNDADPAGRYDGVGFRCVAPPQDSLPAGQAGKK